MESVSSLRINHTASHAPRHTIGGFFFAKTYTIESQKSRNRFHAFNEELVCFAHILSHEQDMM